LKTISAYWQEPETVIVDINNFNGNRNCILEVPFGTKSKYSKIATWKNFQIVEREK
jgi:hypothetical protein